VEPTPGDVYGLVVAAVVLALVAAFAFAVVRWAKPRAESPEGDAQPVRLERDLAA
jgi:hypothetical protein